MEPNGNMIISIHVMLFHSMLFHSYSILLHVNNADGVNVMKCFLWEQCCFHAMPSMCPFS